MEGGGAYGRAMRLATLTVLPYIKKPQVKLRSIGLVFSVICVDVNPLRFRWNPMCASRVRQLFFYISVDVIALLGLVGFLVLDALFDNISSVQRRKYVVIADMAFSGFWTVMWFACFCYLTDNVITGNVEGDVVHAGIAFSFFSIPAFAGLTYMAVMKARKEVGGVFVFHRYSNDTNVVPSSTPISVPGVTDDTFLPMPFSCGSVQKGNTGDIVFTQPQY